LLRTSLVNAARFATYRDFAQADGQREAQMIRLDVEARVDLCPAWSSARPGNGLEHAVDAPLRAPERAPAGSALPGLAKPAPTTDDARFRRPRGRARP
jgi:hypothetical protein